MSVPKFSDIGKAASDLFSDDFGGSANKFTFKSTSLNGTNIKVEGARSNSNAQVSGLLETKFTHKPSGVTIKEKWTTKNVVTTELSVKNKLVQGSDATLCANFNPNGGGVSGLTLKTGKKGDKYAFNADLCSNSVKANGVFAYGKWLFGAGTTFGISNSSLKNNKVTIGYVEQDIAVTSSITDGSTVEGSIFHTPKAAVETGVQFSWSKGTQQTGFAFATKYDLDALAFVKAKVDQNLNVGLSYVQKVRPDVTLRLSADVNGSKLSSDAHNVGFHITFGN